MNSGTLWVRVTGPLTDFAPGFAEELRRLGYAHGSARNQLRVVAHLSRWLAGQGLSLSELTRPRLIEFLAVRRNAGCTCWVTDRGLAPLVHYLVRLEAIPAPKMAVETTPVDLLLEAYGRYLVTERGLTIRTVTHYRAVVRPFLEQRVHAGRLELEGLGTAHVTSFVLRACGRLEVESAKYLLTALRSLLRYRHLAWTTPDLVAAVPSVAGWRCR